MAALFQSPSTSDSVDARSPEATPSAASLTHSADAASVPATATATAAAPGSAPSAPLKRTRVLLSCAPCRTSKLKCDREQPCSQCLKKGRVEGCVYAPRPEKPKPNKSMAARLKRLEGMVRDMMDGEAPPQPSAERDDSVRGRGQVILGGGSATYVGATHFMAMLDDVRLLIFPVTALLAIQLFCCHQVAALRASAGPSDLKRLT